MAAAPLTCLPDQRPPSTQFGPAAKRRDLPVAAGTAAATGTVPSVWCGLSLPCPIASCPALEPIFDPTHSADFPKQMRAAALHAQAPHDQPKIAIRSRHDRRGAAMKSRRHCCEIAIQAHRHRPSVAPDSRCWARIVRAIDNPGSDSSHAISYLANSSQRMPWRFLLALAWPSLRIGAMRPSRYVLSR